MEINEARNLKTGDSVIAYNGNGKQYGIVSKIEAHHRSGLWISFRYLIASGNKCMARKKHISVYLPAIASEREKCAATRDHIERGGMEGRKCLLAGCALHGK